MDGNHRRSDERVVGAPRCVHFKCGGLRESVRCCWWHSRRYSIRRHPIDTTGEPYLLCEDPNSSPNFCYDYIPAVPGPPESTTPDEVVGLTTSVWWESYFGFTCSDYSPDEFRFVRRFDPEWWDFYQQVCLPNISPTPTNPTPTAPTRSAWQNQVNRFDVSNDAAVSAFDALVVINFINRNPDSLSVSTATIEMFADVNGDFQVSAADALSVINRLTQLATTASAEAEVVTEPHSLVDRTLEMADGHSNVETWMLF